MDSLCSSMNSVHLQGGANYFFDVQCLVHAFEAETSITVDQFLEDLNQGATLPENPYDYLHLFDDKDRAVAILWERGVPIPENLLSRLITLSCSPQTIKQFINYPFCELQPSHYIDARLSKHVFTLIFGFLDCGLEVQKTTLADLLYFSSDDVLNNRQFQQVFALMLPHSALCADLLNLTLIRNRSSDEIMQLIGRGVAVNLTTCFLASMVSDHQLSASLNDYCLRQMEGAHPAIKELYHYIPGQPFNYDAFKSSLEANPCDDSALVVGAIIKGLDPNFVDELVNELPGDLEGLEEYFYLQQLIS